jgi:hypothetical protein
MILKKQPKKINEKFKQNFILHILNIFVHLFEI